MKDLLLNIGFLPKENSNNIFIKKYINLNNYAIEVDFTNKKFDYGNKIIAESKTTQNFSQDENWVVLECVNRLLEKGYNPADITLEKTFPSGHGHSGRLDIFVKKDNKAFLMVECKIWGKEFDKEYSNIKKNGGQLFTYFQNDKNTQYLMLYASNFDSQNQVLEYQNEIIIIEDSYKETANVVDLFERWNKFTKNNGIFDNWVNAYNFQNKALRLADIKNIKQDDSSFIFNRFLEILRHNAVSDKPNAFNKIFTLFLCKIKDEDKNPDDELEFQWIEGQDDDVRFQLRLSDLYKLAMNEFLEKEITDFSNQEFDKEFGLLDEATKQLLRKKIIELRLQKNNEFAIKEVFDKETFEENAIVLKEVVELLQNYRFRYNKKQPFLGNFFELLLTTGLKQEVGQFFTPVPIARFICKSIPLKEKTLEKLQIGTTDELLPNIIDYAVGSGHFLTEAMEEVQNITQTIDNKGLSPKTRKKLRTWGEDQFEWAYTYIYGIERDYRLVKTTKVGCYLHGDGIANIIHGDGLDSFASNKYRGKLKSNDKNNAKFDFVLSNPPYSVSAFKNNTKASAETSNLYNNLTDQSSEIEALFIERAAQLLKEGGIAALILPSSILNNSGIYTKARNIILTQFEIIAITKLGSATFMATGTNTVVLFLQRRSDYDEINFAKSIKDSIINNKDITINSIENVLSKYLKHVWQNITINDFTTLIKQQPNENILKNELFIEYETKLKSKNKEDLYKQIIKIEQEKMLYFVLTYKQNVIVVDTGEKKAEKQFLGYEFSNRRGHEGIHPIQRSKTIDECTKLYDATTWDNPEKASYYIYQNFLGNTPEIDENLKNNISQFNLVDMIEWESASFDKTISLQVKKKIEINTKWELVSLQELKELNFINGYAFKSSNLKDVKTSDEELPVLKIGNINKNKKITALDDCQFHDYINYKDKITLENSIAIALTGATVGKAGWTTKKCLINQRVLVIDSSHNILKYISYFIINDLFYEYAQNLAHGNAQGNLSPAQVTSFQIPLPPKDIQEKIISEIEAVETQTIKNSDEINRLTQQINAIIDEVFNNSYQLTKLGDVAEIQNGGTPSTKKTEYWNGGIAWATLVDTKNKYLTKTQRNISDLGVNNSSATLLPVHSILFSSRATIGDVCIAKIETCTNQGYKNFICNNEKLYYEYLYYILKHETKNIINLASGMTYPEISKTAISNYKIPLPQVEIQQQIVKKINKLEQEINKLQQYINGVNNLKSAILTKYL
jgi:type I restriction enzyme M protein